jgi:hypothetical protein
MSSIVALSGFGGRVVEKGEGAEEMKWRRRAEVRDVTMAAELPNPVLCTSEIGTPRCANGTGAAPYGRDESLSQVVNGRDWDVTHSTRLRVEVIGSYDGDAERLVRCRGVESCG